MLATALLLVLSQQPPCLNAYGTTACGYACKADSGQVKCAQTPDGICEAGGGQVVCFDPSPAVRASVPSLPRPTCKAIGGKPVCGYNCAQADGALACAQTPAGVCDAHYGKAVCFDPPPEVYAVWGALVPAPSCEAREGKVVCGYGCVSGGGNTVCAKTPAGVCIERLGKAVCFDPPARSLCAHGATIPKAACVAEGGNMACGYDCQSFSGDVKCAQTPEGKCRDKNGGGTICFDPPIEVGSQRCSAVLGTETAR